MRADAVRNYQRVLDAARDVIAEYGIEAPMEVIATRAGVGIGTVYRRFPSKRALIAELVRINMDELAETARGALELAGGVGLEAWLAAVARRFADQRGYADKLVGQADEQSAEVLRLLVDDLLENAKTHGRVRDDITLGDVMTTAWAMRGVIDTAGDIATRAWERHLEIHLAGMRSTDAADALTRPTVTRLQLAQISSMRVAGSGAAAPN
ncbi:MAG: TetR family transcriptional regulator [Pseudonocardiales bacterium]|nr:TetR family transcriptional regulator [Pseudonocardiales bacterium]